MPRIQSANNAETSLIAGITPSDNSFQVADATNFPNAPFRISINAEIMEVGMIDKLTNTFSNILRGREGTVAASHLAGTSVQNRFTSGTYDELVSQDELSNEVSNLNGQISSINGDINSIENDINNLEDNLTDHENDKNNPHEVKVSQLKPIAARFYRSASQNIAHLTTTKLIWNESEYDTDSMHSDPNFWTFATINTAGYYHIAANVSLTGAGTGGTQRRAAILKGTEHIAHQRASNDNTVVLSMSTVTKCNVGDQISVEILTDAGTTCNVQVLNRLPNLSITLLSGV